MAHAIVQARPAPSRVLVTGANGFIGSALCRALTEAGVTMRRAVRRTIAAENQPKKSTFEVGEISGSANWTEALRGIECVVHLVSPAGVEGAATADQLAQYRRVNVAGSRRLAEQAAAAGTRRLVFMSTIKVNGEASRERPFTENDLPRPEDAYGISKWEAEQVLRRIAAETGLEVIVLRAPLVYGPGVKGNFLRLMNWVARGWPLPLASVHNCRSLIYLGNLVDAIIAAVNAPQPIDQTYLVSDGEDVSTPELVRRIAAALGVRPRLLPCPVALLRLGAAALGRADDVARLIGSLQIDSSKIRRELGWTPRYDMASGLQETARWFKSGES